MEERRYIYINDLQYGPIYQTQVLDWLNLYNQAGIRFELVQILQVSNIIRPINLYNQIKIIREKTKVPISFIFILPFSVKWTAYLNALKLFIWLIPSLIRGKKIVVFSRTFVGREIRLIKKITPGRVKFIFDGRAASAEERKYILRKENISNIQSEEFINKVHSLENESLTSADRIFCVSNNLSRYFEQQYKVPKERFFLYPCLSYSSKFYFDAALRTDIRNKLNIKDHEKVFIYAGGIKARWHMADEMFQFFLELTDYNSGVKFIFLTNEQEVFSKVIEKYPQLAGKLIYLSVNNNEVVKYLNAADYGIIFRENTIMNNVASPTKFAEYMLCGLPVLISEGVGDYTKFVEETKTGFTFNQKVLSDWANIDFDSIIRSEFNREYIAELGRCHFSKEVLLESVINIMKEV